jgi:hypothetical protein
VDWGELLGYGLALLWLLRPLLRRKREEETHSAPSPATLSQSADAELAQVETVALQVLPKLDPVLREHFGVWLERDLLGRLRRRRAELAKLGQPADLEALLKVLAGVQRELPADREKLFALRTLTERRSDPARVTEQATADALLADLVAPLRYFAKQELRGWAIPGPVALVHASGHRDTLMTSGLGVSIVPVAAGAQPWRWSELGRGLGYHLQAALPEFGPELHTALGLEPSGEEVRADSIALAQLLFDSWSSALVADAIGLLLFGASYLEMLVHAGEDHDPNAATKVGLNREGAVLPTPPEFVRVQLAAHWLTRAGDDTSARRLTRIWAGEHGEVPGLRFRSQTGFNTLPLEPLMGFLRGLVDRLEAHSFRALGGNRLAQCPGLSGWNHLSGSAQRNAAELIRGHSCEASARVLIAAATRAALLDAGATHAIQEALARSALAPPHGAARGPTHIPAPTRTRAPSSKSARARRMAEALLLAETLRSPRRDARFSSP